jgi:hypothetical protein
MKKGFLGMLAAITLILTVNITAQKYVLIGTLTAANAADTTSFLNYNNDNLSLFVHSNDSLVVEIKTQYKMGNLTNFVEVLDTFTTASNTGAALGINLKGYGTNEVPGANYFRWIVTRLANSGVSTNYYLGVMASD